VIVTGVAKSVSGLCPVPHCHNCVHTFSSYWQAKQGLRLCGCGYMTTWSLVFRHCTFLFIFFYSLLLSSVSLCLIAQIPGAGRALSSGAVGHDVRPSTPRAITYKWRGCNSPLSYQSFSACCVEVTSDTEKPRVARLPGSSVLSFAWCVFGCTLPGDQVRFAEKHGLKPILITRLTSAHVVRTPMRCTVNAYCFVCVSFPPLLCATVQNDAVYSGYD